MGLMFRTWKSLREFLSTYYPGIDLETKTRDELVKMFWDKGHLYSVSGKMKLPPWHEGEGLIGWIKGIING